MNVQMAYNLFLVDHEAYCSEQSIVYYRFNVQKFVDFLSDQIGSAPDLIECDVISRELVLAYLSQLRGTGCKNTSINTYFRAAKVFLNYCTAAAKLSFTYDNRNKQRTQHSRKSTEQNTLCIGYNSDVGHIIHNLISVVYYVRKGIYTN